MLYGFAFGGLSEPRSTQHVLFSCFCALLVSTAYHLSRSASDCTYLWMIIKSSFIIHHDEDEELRKAAKIVKNEKEKLNKKNNTNDNNMHTKQTNDHKIEMKINSMSDNEEVLEKDELKDPLPKKLKNTVNSRLKNDLLVCTVISIIVLSLHSSTVFTALQPELNPMLQSFVIVLGFVLHYLIPQMRKYLPWLCFAKPILKQKEYGMYETSEAARVMWFETLFVYLSFVEKNILLPLIFISVSTKGC